MDLGIALLRRDAASVYGAWFAITGPIAAVFLVAEFLTPSLIPTILFWWLKPLFDRIVLHVLSQSLFGAKPSVRATVRSAPQFFRGWWFTALFWRRLDLARAFNLPVWQLEGLRGAAVRSRLGVLNAKARGSAIGSAVVCMHLVLAIEVAILGLVFAFIPAEWVNYQDVFSWLFVEPSPASGMVLFCVYYIAETVIEPLFVASGFGLYLGRRTQLEAWDLELAFRKLALRLAPAVGALLLCVCLLPSPGMATPATVPADSWEAALDAAPDYWSRRVDSGYPGDDERWVQTARDIHADTQFGYQDEGWELKPRSEPEEGADDSNWVSWFGTFSEAMSILMELLLWLGAAALAIVVGRYLWLRRDALKLAPANPKPEVFLIDVAEDDTVSLPADVAAAALSALDKGDTVLAVSLLYRGSLARFQSQGLVLPQGATESECLRSAATVAVDQQIDLFGKIVRFWQASAYAHQAPDSEAIREIIRGWRPAFGVAQ